MTNPERPQDEPLEPEIVDGSAMLAAINRAEVDIQIATAKRYPRSVQLFKAQARTLATLDEDTAATMFYALPREGKTIDGPSIRFAEVVGSSWGNLRYGARIVSIDEKHVTAQGACYDLERNLAATVEAKRRITNKYGKRYGDDMITVTSQAAMSIALRNAIFRVVPFALVKDIYEEARAASIGKGKTMAQRRQAAVDIFAKWGVAPDKMCLIAGRPSLDDLDDESLIRLRGIVTAIRDGETSIDEVLRDVASGPTTVTPETLGAAGGVTATAVAAGTVTGHDQDDAPVVDQAQPPAIGAVTDAKAIGDAVRARVEEIKTEIAVRGVKQAIADHLFKKHVGATAATMDTMEWNETTYVALGKVLTDIRTIPAAPKK